MIQGPTPSLELLENRAEILCLFEMIFESLKQGIKLFLRKSRESLSGSRHSGLFKIHVYNYEAHKSVR